MRTEGSAGTYKRTVTMDIDIKIYLNWTNNIFWLPAYFPYPYNNVANFYNWGACIFAIIIAAVSLHSSTYPFCASLWRKHHTNRHTNTRIINKFCVQVCNHRRHQCQKMGRRLMVMMVILQWKHSSVYLIRIVYEKRERMILLWVFTWLHFMIWTTTLWICLSFFY